MAIIIIIKILIIIMIIFSGLKYKYSLQNKIEQLKEMGRFLKLLSLGINQACAIHSL